MRIETGKAAAIDIASYDVHIKNGDYPPRSRGRPEVVIMSTNFRTRAAGCRYQHFKTGIELAVRNVSDENIASAIFAVDLFDAAGNFITTFRHTEIDIRDVSRAFLIQTTNIKEDVVRSYNIKIIKTVLPISKRCSVAQ